MAEQWTNSPKSVRISSLKPRGRGGHHDFSTRGMDKRLIERLKSSRRAWPPIYVIPCSGGYRVEDGHHRVIAAMQLGQRSIDALVFVRVK